MSTHLTTEATAVVVARCSLGRELLDKLLGASGENWPQKQFMNYSKVVLPICKKRLMATRNTQLA